MNQMKIRLDARVYDVENLLPLNPLAVTMCHYLVEIKGVNGFWMAD